MENITPDEENALAQAEIQQREHSNRNARRNVVAAGDLITIMPIIGGTLPTDVISHLNENVLFRAEYALAQAEILQREHREAEARRREAAFSCGEEIARDEVGLITRTPNRSRRMLGNMRNRFPRLRLNSVADDVVYSDGEND